MVKTESICCNNCGGPLEIPDSANFVTCNHCSSNLAVKRNDSVTFTQQIEKLGEQQTEMLTRLDRIEQQNRVAQIDRNWERKRKNYLSVDKHGNLREPNSGIGGVVAGIFAIIMGGAVQPIFLIFGLVIIGVSVANAAFASQKRREYEAAKRSYLDRRNRALKE